MTKKLLTIICMAVMLTACGNADSSTAVTTPAGQTTTTTTTTTEATETESKTSSQTSEDETVTSETTTTPTQTEEPTITTTTPEEITTTTTTAETTKPKVTTTTKKSTTTKKQTTTTKVTTTKPKTTTTTAKKTTTTTTTTTKKVEQPPEGRVMYSCGVTMMKKAKETSAILIEEIPMDKKITVVGDMISNEYGNWYNIYYDGQYGYCYVNGLSNLPSSRWDEELCNLINDYRESLGLEKLKIDQRLMEAAQIRLDEQKVSAGHTRPDGSSCFTVFAEVGITDERCLGVENLGGGATPQVIFKGWKNSSGHNRNMTYANSVAMGVAFDIERGSWVFLARTAESDE